MAPPEPGGGDVSVTEPGKGGPRPEQLRIASYNVHACIGTDRMYNPDRVARVIREMEPDIVGLQEVDVGYWNAHSTAQIERLERTTGMRGIAGPTLVGQGGHYGNALLTHWPMREVRRLDLSVKGWEPRGVLDVDLDVCGTTVRIVVTHFGLNQGERRAQSGVLVRALKEIRTPLLVVLGDFNEWRLRGKIFYKLNALLGRSPTVRTWPSRIPLLALDRIWVQPKEALRNLHAHRSPLSRVASDHLPLLTCIGLPKRGAKT